MANAMRARYQSMAAATALRVCQRWGDTATYTNGSGTAKTIYVLSKTIERITFEQDSENLTITVPYQTNFTASPDSGSTITVGSTKYAIETVTPDDGEYPSTWELSCRRWLHATAEVDG